jgi:hypothetical protein
LILIDTRASCQISLDTAMETWEDDLRRFILEQEEEDDDFFSFGPCTSTVPL